MPARPNFDLHVFRQVRRGNRVSKSQRNVVVHALRDFTDRAFASAKKNLVERIGLRLPEYRQRCVAKLLELGTDLLPRVERSLNRKADQWLAPDVARLSCSRAIAGSTQAD